MSWFTKGQTEQEQREEPFKNSYKNLYGQKSYERKDTFLTENAKVSQFQTAANETSKIINHSQKTTHFIMLFRK